MVLMAGMLILAGIWAGIWSGSKLHPIEPKGNSEYMKAMITTTLVVAIACFGKRMLSRAPAQSANTDSESDEEPPGGLPSVSGEEKPEE